MKLLTPLAIALCTLTLTAGCGAKTSAPEVSAAPSPETSSVQQTASVQGTASAQQTASVQGTDSAQQTTSPQQTASVSETKTPAAASTKPDATQATPATPAPTVSATPAPKQEEFFGYLIDRCCFEDPGPEEDTWDCLLMDSCRASGYGLAIPSDSAGNVNGYIWYEFDDPGQELAYQTILNSNKWVQISVKVTGTLKDGIIEVKTMKEG